MPIVPSRRAGVGRVSLAKGGPRVACVSGSEVEDRWDYPIPLEGYTQAMTVCSSNLLVLQRRQQTCLCAVDYPLFLVA